MQYQSRGHDSNQVGSYLYWCTYTTLTCTGVSNTWV